MATVTVGPPQQSGEETLYDVKCGSVVFTVTFRPVDRNDPHLNENPTATWEADVRLPDGTGFGQYGISRADAFRNAHTAATQKGAFAGVDWAAVTTALASARAFG